MAGENNGDEQGKFMRCFPLSSAVTRYSHRGRAVVGDEATLTGLLADHQMSAYRRIVLKKSCFGSGRWSWHDVIEL